MAKFTRIEIHFEAAGVPRVATILPPVEKGRGVQQVFLDRPGPFNDPMPPDITLDNPTGVTATDGPMLCYRVNGELVCW